MALDRTREDGEGLVMAGVIVAGVREDRIVWGRLYIEPIEAVDESIDAAVRKMAGRPSEDRWAARRHPRGEETDGARGTV